MKLKRIGFILAVTAIIITATVNCFALGGVNPLGYENATCMLQKFYNQSAYSNVNTDHGLDVHQTRDSRSAKTQISTASSLNCYVVTGVYSDNGTVTGAHYKTEVIRPSSKWNNSITAKVSIKSSVNVRCAQHYASHPSFCGGKEHIFYYYDKSHSSDPK